MPRKLTKILATISSTNCSEAFLSALHEAGMDAIRLNTAHITPEDALPIVKKVRALSEQIAILLDTKGPEVRTREITTPIAVMQNDEVRIVRTSPLGKSFCVSYAGFVDEVPEGTSILIEDGTLELKVIGKETDALICQAQNSGSIVVKKNVNVPSVQLQLPALSGKDEEFIHFAALHDIDYIAHSFVRNADDIRAVQNILDQYNSPVKIIAKIENTAGIQHLDTILDVCAGIMVARGDLGVEIPFEKLPVIQKRIIQSCVHKAKVVITATQMLHTMIENPRPTRAEVSDVANAVFDGTDVLMLSGETANGKYPVEAVATMTKIAQEAENERPHGWDFQTEGTANHRRSYLARAAAHASREVPIKAIVADSESGRIARLLSSYRTGVPIYVRSPNIRTVRELALSYGVYADLLPPQTNTEELVHYSIASLIADGSLKPEDDVVVIGGTPGQSGATNFLLINTAANCIQEIPLG